MARSRLLALLLLLITLLVYWPVRHYGFLVYDDPEYVTDNQMVQTGLSWAGVKWAFTTYRVSNWNPLTWLSHMLDAELFGPDPGPQHVVNLLLHAANVLLLFWLLQQMTGEWAPSAFVAAAFAWHPLHVESVAWISERKDVLSTFFGLLTLCAYARYATPAENRANEVPARRRSRILAYGMALLFFALSLLAKPMLVTLPFLLLLLDYWPLNRWLEKSRELSRSSPATSPPAFQTFFFLAMEKWPFFLLTAGSCFMTSLAQHEDAIHGFVFDPFPARAANALVSYVRYLGKTVWPMHLAVFYPRTHWSAASTAAAAALLIGISAAAWIKRRQQPYLWVGWLWFLGLLTPVIGLAPFGGHAMADRYTYLPLVGVFVAITWGLRDWARPGRFRLQACAAAGFLSLTACIFLTRHQLAFWRNSDVLFSHAVAVTEKNDIAQINLGVALEQEGFKDAALDHYREALRINPNRVQAHNNLANLLAEMGKYPEALSEYRQALRLDPNSSLTHENLGVLLVETGRFDEAKQEYSEAERLAPAEARPHYLMGKLLLRSGGTEQAVASFRTALRLYPKDARSATYLARILAADTNPQIRNGSEAVKLAEDANEWTGGQQPFVLDALAMAYAETGHFDKARQAAQKALELAADHGIHDLAPDLQTRLRLYEAGQPYRESLTNAAPASLP